MASTFRAWSTSPARACAGSQPRRRDADHLARRLLLRRTACRLTAAADDHHRSGRAAPGGPSGPGRRRHQHRQRQLLVDVGGSLAYRPISNRMAWPGCPWSVCKLGPRWCRCAGASATTTPAWLDAVAHLQASCRQRRADCRAPCRSACRPNPSPGCGALPRCCTMRWMMATLACSVAACSALIWVKLAESMFRADTSIRDTRCPQICMSLLIFQATWGSTPGARPPGAGRRASLASCRSCELLLPLSCCAGQREVDAQTRHFHVMPL